MKKLFIIYGEQGAGKTSLINSFECKDNTLVLDDYVINKNTISDFITEITRFFNLGKTKFVKFVKTEKIEIDQIVVITHYKLEDETIRKIREKTEEKILISQFEAKKYE